MRTLLILIIAGFVLLTLGSPDKVEHSITHISQVLKQLPEKSAFVAPHHTQVSNAETKLETVDFTHVGEQEDIPTGEVLDAPNKHEGDIIRVTTNVPNSTGSDRTDIHTFDEIHALNAETLTTLDRITKTYQ